MSKKMLIILLSTVISFGSFSGCGANKSEEESIPETESVSDSELPSGDVSLRVWGSEEDSELINQIISSFVSEYSSQANFNITFEPHSESSAKDDILGDVLNAPDVFTFADDQLLALIASGVLKKVPNDSEIAGRNLAAASEAASFNGTLYAYPLTADNGYFLFYNSKYLTEEDVQTLDGILEVASREGKKFFMEMNSGWYMYSFFGNTDMEIGLNDDGISTYCNWNAKYTNIKGVDVAQAMADIGKNPGFINAGNDDFGIGAANGSIIAGVSGIWDENEIKDAWGDGYAATKLPTYTVAGQQLQMSSYAGYKLVGVNSRSENAAWANKFADWMTNEQNQALRFSMRGQGPSNTAASSTGEVAQSKGLQALQKQAEYASLQRVGGTFWDPATNLGTILSEGNPGGKDLQTLLNEMVTAVTGVESSGNKEGEEGEAEDTASEEEATEEAASDDSIEENADAGSDEVAEASPEDNADAQASSEASE
ncbi:arabinogalactan oligomer / maltooligosaccharide transport system substrate-binding protein [Butyrivibrio hungatei]|uniref:Arabinogalactan oligomer / maltooligosaccharide transport system substrate-binding protein n=1 Tax=Butyrivibrio hungatei TaxID=185008 RepID=A0A1G5D8K0_9FIRM|nr:extracellular solute-binding protein [Butyrivibrio hungatei]SCY11169.1 arabinogalactan oligomer / maltooligosaccharide transport system substrate-binding protein [Butyrivibrio hungatei]